MDVKLILATEDDAELIHQMKYEAFLPIYETYHDEETSPVKEKLEKVIKKIHSEKSDYYLIKFQKGVVGAVCIVEKVRGALDISPMFVLPKYQNLGIGQSVMEEIFALYPNTDWRLDTILEEKRNCHFYEKCGFVRTEYYDIINDKMTIVGYEKKGTKVT